MHDENELKQFDKWGKPRPSHEPHGTAEDIRANLKRLDCSGWRLEGNLLKCDTDMGELCQTIDPSYILLGVDESGLPIFRKLV